MSQSNDSSAPCADKRGHGKSTTSVCGTRCSETRGQKKRNLANVNKVLPHEVAQTVKGSNDTRFYGVGSGDVGKELPRNKSVLCVLFVGELAQKHRQETFPTYMFVAGIILRVNHCCTRCFPHHSPLFASRACDTVETGLI